ncbi:MAG: sigma-70 family RNA polymerase sigma factor [Chloroflexota bacterium]
MVDKLDAPIDDETLARRAKNDSEAFSVLYRRYLDRVYRYLLSRVGLVQEAQDLTSQTFMAAWEGIARYQGQGVFAAWLFGIARRKANDYFRASRIEIALDEIEDFPGDSLSPEVLVETHMHMEQVAHCLSRISAERAEALALRVFGGLSAAETGELMGKREDAINTLVHRAMRDLRQQLVTTVEVES